MATAKQEYIFKEQTQVNFVCQRCCQPLRLDSSFNSIDEKIMAELSAPLITHSEIDDTVHINPNDAKIGSDSDDISRRCILPVRLTDSGNGFMLVGETHISTEKTEFQQNLIKSYLFDILSDNSDVDHPLCEDCTDTLLDLMDAQLKVTEDECKDYREFLEEIEKNPNYYKENILEEELKKLKEEEAVLQKHLQTVEAQRQETASLLEEQQEEHQRLDLLEYKYWEEYAEYKRQLLEFEDEQRSVDTQLRYAQAQLDRLKKTNVFNATFHIWHSGHFGTINNFRLGRLPSVPVDWSEINAAWGQTVLLLHSLAQKMDLKFQRYRLVPYGNHSFLESLIDKSKELPLYGSGGFRFFWDTKFDQAMVAFLDCLQQFKEEVEKGDTGFCLPYKMDKGKIEDSGSGNSYSIKIQFNSEEQWTKALKFMLTNLKWGLAWVSSQFSN